MFRITTHNGTHGFVMKLEGWLSGAWVQELETTWRNAMSGPQGPRICADLRDVYFVDEAGRELLTEMYRAGVNFVAGGCEMPELVREISEATSVGGRK
jgi:anti-anti-sigma regulatory factor